MLIPDELASVETVPACTVFVRGSLSPHWDGVVQLLQRVVRSAVGRRLVRYRTGAAAQWFSLDRDDSAWLREPGQAATGCRWLELAQGPGDSGLHVELADLMDVGGVQRASYVQVRFNADALPADIVQVAELAMNHLPVWWGTAGWIFHVDSGRPFTAHTRLAALAKRLWGVQIIDMTALQWEALRGMPGVNWLNLVSGDFAEAHGLNLTDLAAEATSALGEGIFHRRNGRSMALAAGPHPLMGDINQGDEMAAYVRLARMLGPLLLSAHRPLAGPFSKPEVLSAWLARFEQPRAWLRCEVMAD